MKTALAMIVTILFLTLSTAFAQKTGYCKTFSAISDQETNDTTLFAVPLDKYFVLQRIYVSGRSGRWSLSANSNFSIKGFLSSNVYISPTFEKYDFLDGSIVFNAEDDLTLSYNAGVGWEMFITIIGYFEDVAPVELSADLNSDGKVNILDFAILSEQWLNSV